MSPAWNQTHLCDKVGSVNCVTAWPQDAIDQPIRWHWGAHHLSIILRGLVCWHDDGILERGRSNSKSWHIVAKGLNNSNMNVINIRHFHSMSEFSCPCYISWLAFPSTAIEEDKTIAWTFRRGLLLFSFVAASLLQLLCIQCCKIIYIFQSPQAEASNTHFVLKIQLEAIPLPRLKICKCISHTWVVGSAPLPKTILSTRPLWGDCVFQ